MWNAQWDALRRARDQPAGAPETELAPSAPLVATAKQYNAEVMREQLEYLLDHQAAGCYFCGACDRFMRVKAVLMEPFR